MMMNKLTQYFKRKRQRKLNRSRAGNALLFFIIYRGLTIASKAKDTFGYVLAVGITMIFGIQTIINALVVTGSIPPTGLPLPLVSSGNTAIIIFMAEIYYFTHKMALFSVFVNAVDKGTVNLYKFRHIAKQVLNV